MRDDRDIRIQIVEGRKKGATRLILSGGEPTMHPKFLDYVALGRRAGYRRIQTVTNGRMFSYPRFLETAAANGLHEITFSLHGHTAKLHDALVGTPGAFVQETAGLKAALASDRFIVNVDIVINKMNVKHLPEMLDTFISWGVREFDLLHVIPFGNAWTDARDHLFYDLDANAEHLRKTFAYSKRSDIHVWLNRFPPQYAEGFEELIQDQYKLNDEVRGRREEFDQYLSIGKKLMCREPDRCKVCYLRDLCDTLDEVLDTRRAPEVDEIRVDRKLPLTGKLPVTRRAHIIASTGEEAIKLAAGVTSEQLWLELDTPSLPECAVPITRVIARTTAQIEAWLPIVATREIDIALDLTKDTAAWLLAQEQLPARLVLVQPTYDRVTDDRRNDVDLPALFGNLHEKFSGFEARTENIPQCLTQQRARPEPRRLRVLDGAMLATDARIDMPKYAQRYVAAGFFTKSLRCKECVHESTCRGVHINWARAHGYATLSPIVGDTASVESTTTLASTLST
jgi:MoaA/NifB/PqqE/SkfB family radical SAM enzyme